MGNFLSRHVYIQWGGSLPGLETWSCGIRFAPLIPANAGAFPEDTIQGILEDGFGPAISNFHARATTGLHYSAKLQYVKANFINVEGHYETQNTHQILYPNVQGAVTGQPPPPNQISLVVTWRSDVQRGAASKGRIYLPLPTVGTLDATTGLLSEAFCAGVEDSATQLIADLKASVFALPPNTWSPAIMSRKASGPATREIANVVVGRVADTQRRRRRGLPESYVD